MALYLFSVRIDSTPPLTCYHVIAPTYERAAALIHARFQEPIIDVERLHEVDVLDRASVLHAVNQVDSHLVPPYASIQIRAFAESADKDLTTKYLVAGLIRAAEFLDLWSKPTEDRVLPPGL